MTYQPTHSAIPQADCVSNAGSGVPGEREQRYRPYQEKLHLQKAEETKHVQS